MSSAMLFSFAALLAIFCHGAGHFLAARLVGIRQMRLRRTATGLRLVSAVPFSSYEAELYCALGGPLSNAAGALLVRVLWTWGIAPVFAAQFIPLSLYLGLLNLLPLPGFDGERILRCFLLTEHRCLPPCSPAASERILSVLGGLFLVFLWLISVYLLLRRGSALSLYLFCIQLFFSMDSPETKN